MRSLGLGRVAELGIFVAVLALGRPVLLPLALAFYLAFVLTPPSNWLERLGVPRAFSVAGVVGAALAVVGGIGTVLVAQAADLTRQARTYALQMSHKLSGLRTGKLGVLEDLSDAVSELSRALDPALGMPEPTASVRVVAAGESTFGRLEQSLGPVLQPLAVVVIVFVIAVFMLGHREDLRGRLIQLVGPANVTVATRTMAEAVNRVSRLLLTQAYINTGFGATVAVGLYVIGTPYALLWGVIAALLRFVPLLGALIATLLPALVAFAVFPGWREAGLTVGLFLGVDTLVTNVVEPLVLGKRTGVSALALLISALFWTWIWGPAGLLLATPFTVCAAVVGRHVPEFGFLAIAFGDEAGLNGEVNFYQRTLAKATKDAYRLAKRRLADSSLAETLDELLVPALGLMLKDLNQGAIDPAVAERVVSEFGDVVTRLGSPRSSDGAPPSAHEVVVGVLAESQADALLLRMLRVVLVEQSCDLTIVTEAGRAPTLAAIIGARPKRVCIAAMLPNGNVNARFLCRRLRNALPDARIVVLCPDAEAAHASEAAARLREAGANSTAASLREAVRMLVDNEATAADASLLELHEAHESTLA